MSLFDEFSKAIGTDGGGGGLLGEIDNVGKGLGDMWHQVSSPFVDTQLGQAALRAGGYALGGPWGQLAVNGALGVNDASNGRSYKNMGNMLSAGTSFGLQGGFASGDVPVGADAISGEDIANGVGWDSAPTAEWYDGMVDNGLSPDVAQGGINAMELNNSMDNLNDGLRQSYMPNIEDTGTEATPSWMDTLQKVGVNVGKSVGRSILNQTPAGQAVGMGMDIYNNPNGQFAGTPGINGNTPQGLQNQQAGAWESGIRGLGTLYMGNEAMKGLSAQRDALQQQQEAMQRQFQSMPTLDSMYGASSPYAAQMKQELARRDAKAGRNSQYGPRAAQLQALLAEKGSQYANAQANSASQYSNANASNAAAQQQANMQQQAIRAQQLNSLFQAGKGIMRDPQVQRGLNGMFDSSALDRMPQASDYSQGGPSMGYYGQSQQPAMDWYE